jgi:hypothetical protein
MFSSGEEKSNIGIKAQGGTNLTLLVFALGILSLTSIGIMTLSVVKQLRPVAFTAINKQLNYQGKLQNAAGITLTDDDYSMMFSIYDAAAAGTRLWTECGTVGTPTARTVAVANGVFSVLLGDTNSNSCPGGTDSNVIDLDFTSDSYYLGLTVESDSEMGPRKRLGASGYAFNATNAELLDGLNTSAAGGSNAFVPVTDGSGHLTLTQNLTLGGVFKNSDGSAAAPSYTFTNDPNTGFYSAAGNNIGVAANGAMISYLMATTNYTDSYFYSPRFITPATTNYPMTLTGRIADGASAVGVILDNSTTLSTAGAKIVSFKNNTTEKAYITKDGDLWHRYLYTDQIAPNTVATLRLVGLAPDGATAVGVNFDNYFALSTSGAKIASFRNATVEKAYIDKDGVGYFSGGNFSGLTASLAVYTDGSKNLTSTAPSSGAIGYWSRATTTLSPATANDIVAITGNAGDLLTLTSTATGASNKALSIAASGATVGTDYGAYISNNGGATTNVGLYATASGATNNYAAIFDAGYVGIGTATPTTKLVVSGLRPLYFDPDNTLSTGYGVRFKASAGGWTQGYGMLGSGGTYLGEFGAYGTDDALTRFYIGTYSSGEKMTILSGGNVGIGVVAPDAKLDVRDGAILNSSTYVNYYRNVAVYNAATTPVTGTMKITLPRSWSDTMMTVTIKGYNYSSNVGAWEVVVSGYNYSGPYWVNYTAEIRGTAPFTQVRLAHDGTKNVILLGATDSTWAYPKIVVAEVMTGHTNITGWGTGWSIAPITDETGIGSIVTPPIYFYVASTGNVGIGTTSPGYTLDVSSAGTRAINAVASVGGSSAVYGAASATGTVTNYGGYFTAAGNTGNAVYGSATATGTVSNFGGDFYAAGNTGTGVRGSATATGAVTNFGGIFVATGNTGYAVFADATATGASQNFGGYFYARANSGVGVLGNATATGAVTNYGGSFYAAGDTGIAVRGSASATGAVSNYGGAFYTAGNSGGAVYGNATATGAVTNYGGMFYSAGDTGTGVLGHATGSGINYGVYGLTSSATGWGGYFTGGLGMYASAARINSLSASSAVYTDASKNLTSTAPTSGAIGYWSRSSTTLSTATAADTVSLTGGLNLNKSPITGAYVAINPWSNGNIGSANGIGLQMNRLLGSNTGRHTITTTGFSGGTSILYDSFYDSAATIPYGGTGTVEVDFNPQMGWTANTASPSFTYVDGMLVLSFYYSYLPTNVTVEMYRYNASSGLDEWTTCYNTSSNNQNPLILSSTSCGINYIKKIKFTFSGGGHVDLGILITELEWFPTREGSANQLAVIPKYYSQNMDVSWTNWNMKSTSDWSTKATISNAGAAYFVGPVGVNDASADASLEVVNDNSGDSFLVADTNDGDTTPFVIQADGDVGIGTASPVSLLHLAKNSTYNSEDTGAIKITDSTLTDTGLILGTDAANDTGYIQSLDPGTSNVTRPLSLNPNGGKVGVGTIAPAATLTVLTQLTAGLNEATYPGVIQISTGGGTTGSIGGLEFKSSTSGSGYGWRIAAPDLGTGEVPLYFQKRLNSASWSDTLTILGTTGYVGVGTTNPLSQFHVNGASVLPGTYHQILVTSNDSAAIDKGGSISFGGSYTGTTPTHWAGISGRKENVTAGNYAGYLALETRANGGNLTEQMRIDSAGNVGIGDTTPDGKLDVEPTGAVTAASYGVHLSNLTTNGTTDGINKYGLYITSTGAWAGAAGAATNNYGLYVNTVSGGDNNYSAYFAGTVQMNSLDASSIVYTDASKNLTSTPPGAGTIGYWSRGGTTLSPATANDVVSVTGTGAIAITGTSSAAGGKGIYGTATDATAVANYGGYFTAAGTAAYTAGVYGEASAAANYVAAMYGVATNTGAYSNFGGVFTANGETGVGVRGEAASTAAAINFGGKFYAQGTASGSTGVYGQATATGAVVNYGGHFEAESTGTGTAGVYGTASGAGTVYGVKGAATDSSAVTNYGGYFTAAGTGSDAAGVYGSSTGTGGIKAIFGGRFLAAGAVTGTAGVYGSASGAGAVYGVQGAATDSTAVANYGGYFTAAGTSSAAGVYAEASGAGIVGGVYGLASDTTAGTANFGGLFEARGDHSWSYGVKGYLPNSVGGKAVIGQAAETTSTNYGGYFTAAGAGAAASGVYGEASGAAAVYGVRGYSSNATAVANYGGYFTANGTGAGATGVYGSAISTGSNANYGGQFYAAGTNARAVYGYATDTGANQTYGGLFRTDSTGGGYGVYGFANGASGTNYAVAGSSTSATGWGGYFTGGYGLYASHGQIARAPSGNDTSYELVVQGTVCIDDTSANCPSTPTSGTLYTEATALQTFDLAELYESTEVLAAGDVVSVDLSSDKKVLKSAGAYQNTTMGVVSTAPGITLGGWSAGPNQYPVALAGRVPVKVNDENGAIAIGDLLTSSSTPGIAMKATRPGQTIGLALEAWAGPGQGTVEVFMAPGWDSAGTIATDGTAIFFNDDFTFNALGTADATVLGYNSKGLTFRGSGWDGAAAQNIEMKLNNVVTDSLNYKLSVLNNAGAEIAYLNQDGAFGISGKFYPASPTGAQSTAYIFYRANRMRTNAAGWATGSFDFAEMFLSNELLEAGDVVVLDEATNEYVKKSTSAYNNMALGIVSTEPGFLSGANVNFDDPSADQGYPIALAGRVPTKVSAENGPIRPGDFLTTSATPGVAMRATESGLIIGTALESFDGPGIGLVKVFVNLSWYNVAGEAIPVDEMAQLTLTGDLNMAGNYILNVGKIVGVDEKWSIDENGILKIKLVAEDASEKEMFGLTSAKVELTLSGTGRLENGSSMIDLSLVDPDFIKNISAETALKIIVTLTEPANGVYIAEKTAYSFRVAELAAGTSDAAFDWIVIARRKGYEDPLTTPAPSEPAPTEPAPSEPAPSEPAPTEPAPSEPAPSEPAPEAPAPEVPPSEPAPSEPAPSEPAPSEPAPSEPAPSEPAPSEPAP